MRKKKLTPIPRLTKKTTAYELLNTVCKLITDEPKRYYQGWWISRQSGFCKSKVSEFPSCGTVGCVAGWVELLRSGPTRAIRAASRTDEIGRAHV